VRTEIGRKVDGVVSIPARQNTYDMCTLEYLQVSEQILDWWSAIEASPARAGGLEPCRMNAGLREDDVLAHIPVF